jgi:hypothetical protein
MREARGKGLFEARFFRLESGKKGWVSRQKTDFPGDFQGSNLTMRENSGQEFFRRH